MSFRKEKKYRLTIFEFNNIKSDLIKKGMCALYKSRQIMSTYYDTPLLDMFYNSEEGVLPRKKIRIRSYNTNDIASIEEKVSSIEGRHKRILARVRKSSIKFTKTIQDQQYGLLTPSLLITYNREYYSLKGFRLTFDTSIKYKSLRNSSELEFQDPERVMEVKTPFDIPDELIETTIPYPTSRFSKYARGLLLSLGQL